MENKNVIANKIKRGVYKHFKNKNYRVLGVARHSETLEDFVVYKCLHKNKLSKMWVRPLKMFIGKVEINGKKVPRFKYVGK